MSFSAREKRQAAGREVGLRRTVYRGRVTRGLMTKSQADYRKLEQEDVPPLFREQA